jgi:ATP-binding protein involved in chromosome partitioning
MFGVPRDVEIKMIRKDIIKPVEVNGIKLMSFSFFMPSSQAVIWRGPLLNNAIHQLLFEVAWGELDFLVVDMPPGTGDVQLSLAQLSNLSGAVIVSTPQSVAIQDAERAVAMFRQVNVPVLGIVENMSEYICPHCGGISHIFSHDGTKFLTDTYHVPLLGAIPLQTEIMQSGEDGTPVVWKEPDGPVAAAYKNIVSNLSVEIRKYEG